MENKKKQLVQQRKQETALMNISTQFPKCILEGHEPSLVSYESSLKIADVFEKPPIRNLTTSNESKAVALTSITFLVNRASKISSVYSDIASGLDVSLAVDLMELMEFETIEDIMLMFKYARQGKLNIDKFEKRRSFYETVLQVYVPMYLDLKSQERDKIYHEKKHKKENIKLNEDYSNKIRKLRISLSKDKKENKPYKVLSQNEKDVVSQNTLKENIKKFAQKKTKAELHLLISEWSKFNDKKQYVYIFQDVLLTK